MDIDNVSSQQRGVLRKEALFREFCKESGLLVKRKKFYAAKRGRDLVMVYLTGAANQSYLLLTASDLWVIRGCNESKVLTHDQLKFLDPIRLYENTTASFWDVLDRKIEAGEIWVGGSLEEGN